MFRRTLQAELRERLLHRGVASRHVRRYLAELADHFADLVAEEQRNGCSATEADSRASARIGSVDQLARAMESRSELRAWSARTPWLVFSLGPLLSVSAAYLVASFLLWSGWHLFLPYSITPFVRISGVSIVWFGMGRLLYFTAPVVVGWGVALLAARQRLRIHWPAVGLALLAVVGATARVQVSHLGAGGRGNRVSMSLNFQEFHPIVHGQQTLAFSVLSPGPLHVLLLFALAALPYVVWRVWREALAES